MSEPPIMAAAPRREPPILHLAQGEVAYSPGVQVGRIRRWLISVLNRGLPALCDEHYHMPELLRAQREGARAWATNEGEDTNPYELPDRRWESWRAGFFAFDDYVAEPPIYISWWCAACGKEIGDHEGYLELSQESLDSYRSLRAAWDEQREHGGSFGGQLISGADLANHPEPAQWLAWHRSCDPAPESGYRSLVEVERIRSGRQLLDWTAHYFEKEWFQETNWDDVIRSAVGGWKLGGERK